jgi:hypothetical protein
LESNSFSPQLLNFRYYFLCPRLVRAVAKGDVRVFLREPLRDGQADSLASARNCRYLSLQPVCHDFLLTPCLEV